MARKPSSQNTTSKDAYRYRFVPGSLSDEQKKDCKAWQFDSADRVNAVMTLASDGYKFTLSADPNGPGMIAYMVPTGDKHKHMGWMLSGRGSDPDKALKQLFYRHFVIFEGDWPMDAQQLSSEDYND